MFDRAHVLRLAGTTEDAAVAAEVDWREVEAIYDSYTAVRKSFAPTLNLVTETLLQAPSVHSVRSRLKDPLSTAAKVVRKRLEDPRRVITADNYRSQLRDLIGLRALHLVKEDWPPIHEHITRTWRQKERPAANIRKGDDPQPFRSRRCQVKEHPDGYRSVHYVIHVNGAFAEIQVRTLIEEAWSELDHRVRYPNKTNDRAVLDFLDIFNRIAGDADAMGSYVSSLRAAPWARPTITPTDETAVSPKGRRTASVLRPTAAD